MLHRFSRVHKILAKIYKIDMVLELLSFALPNFTTDKCALLGAKIPLISKKNFPMLREAINLFEKSCHYRISDVADFTSMESLANFFVA